MERLVNSIIKINTPELQEYCLGLGYKTEYPNDLSLEYLHAHEDFEPHRYHLSSISPWFLKNLQGAMIFDSNQVEEFKNSINP